LFAGSDEGAENWACLASLIETCKLNGVITQTYFTDLLTRLVTYRNMSTTLIYRVRNTVEAAHETESKGRRKLSIPVAMPGRRKAAEDSRTSNEP
jgi:hypothetical protein